jgi:hypothetical protein
MKRMKNLNFNICKNISRRWFLLKTFSVIGIVGIAFAPVVTMNILSQTAGFSPSLISSNGILTVQAKDTYYDGADGTRFAAVPLPVGASQLQFRVAGGVITDGSERLASGDGLYANGQTPYNWTTTHWNGTYQNTHVGSTTGIDPALFGVFFSPGFVGTPADSQNFRSDSGVVPDPRTLLTYAPALNQPFYIGDGYTSNNAFITNDDSFIPAGTNQTFVIPAGATYLLLGIGADVNMSDNQNASNTNSAFLVHVFDDCAAPPIISSITGADAIFQGGTCALSVVMAAGSLPLTYQWSSNGTNLTDNGHLSGSQSNVLSLINVQFGDSGVYGVVVSNSWGRATSNVPLTVHPSIAFNHLNIPAKAEIHGAGNAGLPDGSGVSPILINLPANSWVLVVSNVSGTISLNSGGAYNDADGVIVSGGGYPGWSYAGVYGGISGIYLPGAGALVGVFEPATGPTSSAPATLDFTSLGTGFTSLAPALYQTFFLGDGRAGDGSGTIQQFFIPAGATRLFLGIPDAGGYNGSPGGYGDNSGAFTATLEVLVTGPQLLGAHWSGTNVIFSFETLTNQSYTVQQNTNLATASWTDCTNILGDGSIYQFTAPVTDAGQRFFRVRQP